MELIDKAAVVAEIWKRRIKHREFGGSPHSEYGHEDDEILGVINSLEVKEADLDYIKNELDEVVRIYKPDGDFGWGTLYNVATHFFELGLKAAQNGE